jgi:hypothetical protein
MNIQHKFHTIFVPAELPVGVGIWVGGVEDVEGCREDDPGNVDGVDGDVEDERVDDDTRDVKVDDGLAAEEDACPFPMNLASFSSIKLLSN